MFIVTVIITLINNHNLYQIQFLNRFMKMDKAVQKDPVIEDEVKYRYSSVIMHYRKSFTQDNAQRVSPLSFELEATLKLARFLCSCVVLDIEGTTTPISFVTDVLFPYARDNVRMQLEETYDSVYTQEGIKLLRSQIEILHQIPHDGEVNRARHQPQHPFRIATKTTSSEVHLFDCRNHPTKYPNGGTSNPDVRLIGHTSDGFDLSSSKVNEGLLLSGSNDSRICLWDTNLTMVNNTLVWKQLL